jgi:hypothetical protein
MFASVNECVIMFTSVNNQSRKDKGGMNEHRSTEVYTRRA